MLNILHGKYILRALANVIFINTTLVYCNVKLLFKKCWNYNSYKLVFKCVTNVAMYTWSIFKNTTKIQYIVLGQYFHINNKSITVKNIFIKHNEYDKLLVN